MSHYNVFLVAPNIKGVHNETYDIIFYYDTEKDTDCLATIDFDYDETHSFYAAFLGFRTEDDYRTFPTLEEARKWTEDTIKKEYITNN